MNPKSQITWKEQNKWSCTCSNEDFNNKNVETHIGSVRKFNIFTISIDNIGKKYSLHVDLPINETRFNLFSLDHGKAISESIMDYFEGYLTKDFLNKKLDAYKLIYSRGF